MTPPFDLTADDVTCYGIPPGVVEQSAIVNGVLVLPQRPDIDAMVRGISRTHYRGQHRDAWCEAWERYTARSFRYPDGKVEHGVAHVDDGPVWLVRREEECSGSSHTQFEPYGYTTYHLVRMDAEPINPMDRERFFQDVQSGELKSLSSDLAGLHFVRPERKCSCVCHQRKLNLNCGFCHGTGTLKAETFDVWRDAESTHKRTVSDE